MAKHSDQSATASRIKAEQGARLKQLRVQMGLTGEDAATMAGVSRDAWGRMERGESVVDAVALCRFLSQHEIGADYVITGGLSGLPADLARELVQVELRLSTAAEAVGRTGQASATAPLRKRVRKSTSGNAKPLSPAG